SNLNCSLPCVLVHGEIKQGTSCQGLQGLQFCQFCGILLPQVVNNSYRVDNNVFCATQILTGDAEYYRQFTHTM
ncbi:hypothetical protein, partial [Streptococcus dysgalactiae]|uniref:hypothetical protein n=1 Tax=Streptococcus dysgalactiae TaxID=1334 RepID=UPI00195195C9